MGLKPRINIQQFFKYGYAEQKMMMCVDTITRVKEMAKETIAAQQVCPACVLHIIYIQRGREREREKQNGERKRERDR